MKLIVATHNAHKLEELTTIFRGEGLEIELCSLFDLSDQTEIVEDGDTLEANALIKAREVYRRYGGDCFSDDTGLEVAALGGAPGVYSARYAGGACDSKANIEKLLTQMRGVLDRKARFRTVIALIIGGEEYLFEGIVEGHITEEPRGIGGFGYDPIFVPRDSELTFAEMGEVAKNSLSHRARAIKNLVTFLKSQS